MKKGLVAAIVGATVAIGLVACSSGTGAGSASSDSAKNSVKIMVFGSFSQPPFPLAQIETAAKAAVAHVNAAGGIAGKDTSVELISCDDKMSANGATACGRQAVQEKVAAVVGAFSLFGDGILPLLEAADIPYINNVAIGAMDSTSEHSFPVMTAGTPMAPILTWLKDKDCGTITLAAPESAQATQSFKAYFEPLAKNLKLTGTMVAYPGNTTDFTSVAQQIADNGSCVIYGGGAQDSAALITALNQTGKEFTQIALSTIAFPESTLTQLGAAGNGVMVFSPFSLPSTGAAATKTAVEEMKAVDAKVVIDETALNSYAGVLTFAQAAAKGDGAVTGASVTKALQTPGNVIDTGLYAATDFTKVTGFFPPVPRAAGNIFQAYIAKDGTFEPEGKPLELTAESLGF
ncbi:ABC transporter substrate-binding protein [Leifsonia kafniensis]